MQKHYWNDHRAASDGKGFSPRNIKSIRRSQLTFHVNVKGLLQRSAPLGIGGGTGERHWPIGPLERRQDEGAPYPARLVQQTQLTRHSHAIPAPADDRLRNT